QDDCWTLTCESIDFTFSLLPCSQPPAVRVVYGDSVNQSFSSSDEVVIPGIIYDTYFDVTLDQICPSSIGLEISIQAGPGFFIIPYTVIPINFTSCGYGSPGIDCPTVTVPPNLDLCQSMRSISDQLNINLELEDTAQQCSPLPSCREVTCNFGGGQFSIALSCSPVGVTLAYVTTDSSPQSQVFTQSG
ncbi:hypothetical protein GBAR_LOCUS25676, partial [Geodia barretti]